MSDIHKLEIGNWVLLHWTINQNSLELIHPEDLDNLVSTLPYKATIASDSLSKVEGYYAQYAILKKASGVFRVVPDKEIIKVVKYDGTLDYGEYVRDKRGKYEGIISGIGWMYKYEKPVFMLMKDGKRIKKRFYQEDLEKV